MKLFEKFFVCPKKSFADLQLGTTDVAEFKCGLADVFCISIVRSKWGKGVGENTIFGLCVCQLCKMTFSKIIFLISNFVKFVPEICLLPCVEIIYILKRLNLKTPFILYQNKKIYGHTPSVGVPTIQSGQFGVKFSEVSSLHIRYI